MTVRSNASGTEALEPLRGRLDRIDERLLETLRARMECCIEIAHVKRAHQVPMMQNHRVGLVHDRAARFGEQHGIDRDFLRRLYEVIIAESCRVEDEIIGNEAARERLE